MSDLLYHKELNDARWNRIKFLFEEPKKVVRPLLNPRKVFNGILRILKSSSRWRDLPSCYGNWNRIYHKFRKWCESGLSWTVIAFGQRRRRALNFHVIINERMQLSLMEKLYKQRNLVERFFSALKILINWLFVSSTLFTCFCRYALLIYQQPLDKNF